MNYLALVKQIRGDHSAAEALYRSALEAGEQHPADLAAIPPQSGPPLRS
jgi:hypothetical protein